MPRKITDKDATLVPEPLSLSLYEIEDRLQSLVDTTEIIDPQDEASKLQILNEIAEADAAGKRKRDGVAKYIRSLEATQDAIDAEIKYLQGRKKALANHEERLRKYVIGIIEQYGTRAGKQRYLQGNIHVLTLRQNPPSVVIEDESLVPLSFKSITITMPLEDWQVILDLCRYMGEDDPEEYTAAQIAECADKSATITISKRDIAKAIEAGEEVPGADIQWGQMRLSV